MVGHGVADVAGNGQAIAPHPFPVSDQHREGLRGRVCSKEGTVIPTEPKVTVLCYAMLCYAKSLQSCLTLCDPIDGSQQPPLSLGFSRQEHWSGFRCMKVKSESEVAQSCPTLIDPMDCSLLGSSIHGIFQARVLE